MSPFSLEAAVETVVTVLSNRAKLLLDTDELVVLSHTVSAAHGTGLDLTTVRSDSDVGDSGVLSLTATVRSYGIVARR